MTYLVSFGFFFFFFVLFLNFKKADLLISIGLNNCNGMIMLYSVSKDIKTCKRMHSTNVKFSEVSS